jgi:hypothetical protein
MLCDKLIALGLTSAAASTVAVAAVAVMHRVCLVAAHYSLIAHTVMRWSN